MNTSRQSIVGRDRTGAAVRFGWLASSSALAIVGAAWAGAADAQACGPPDANNVVNCSPGTYTGINYNNPPGITINIPAGVTVTDEGVTGRGAGDITINGNASDTFTSTDPNHEALGGRTSNGNVTLTGGAVSSATTAIVARTDNGNVSIHVGDVSGAAGGQGIFVAGFSSGAPDNVSITTGNVSGDHGGIGVAGATGTVTINSDNVSGGSGLGISIGSPGAPAPTDVSITANSLSGKQGGVFVEGATGNVSVAVAGAVSSSATGGINIGDGNGGAPIKVTVSAGSVSAATAGIIVGGNTGNVSIAVAGSVSSANNTGIIVGFDPNTANAPQNVTVTAGSVSGGNAGVDITGATGNVSVSVAGNVSGASAAGVDVLSNSGFAPNNVTITTGNVSAGVDGIDVEGATGTVTVTVNGNVSAPNATGIALATAGSAKVTVQTGASVSGVTGVDGTVGGGVAGGLSVIDNGTITGTGGTAIQFQPGPSVLSGDGTANGDVTIQPGGFFAPGDLVTFSINGHLVFSGGSTYVAEVAAGRPGRSGAPGDLIAVNGVVTIAPGATFEALPLGSASSYANNTQYIVITATGGVSGTFSNVISAAPLLSASLLYPHDEVVLFLKRNDKSFASQAVTPNQAAAAAAIEAGGSDSSLYEALVGQTALGLQQGYASLSGEGYADEGSVLLDQSDQDRRTLVGRMNQPASANGLWVTTYGDTKTADAGANFAHARSQLGGGESGVDFTLKGWRLGIATGFGYDSLAISSRATATLDAFWSMSTYAAYASGPFDMKLGATYSWHRLSSSREVAFPGFADANRSLSHVAAGEAFAEAGWTFKSEHGWVEPFAGVSIDTVSGYAAIEAGGVSALSVATGARTVISERFGVQGQTALFGVPGLSLKGALDWRHAEGDLSGAARLTFQDTGASFTVHGLPIAADGAEITAALEAKPWRGTTLDLAYHGEVGDHFSDNALKFNARWAF